MANETTLLKLGLKAGESAFVEFEGKKVQIIMVGYSKAKYSLIFKAPREVSIVRESAKKKEEAPREQ